MGAYFFTAIRFTRWVYLTTHFNQSLFFFYRNVICAYWTKKDFFNLQIALFSKVFNVDAIFQERRKKIEKSGAHFWGVLHFRHYLQILRKSINYWPKINSLRSELKPKRFARKLKLFGASVCVYINALRKWWFTVSDIFHELAPAASIEIHLSLVGTPVTIGQQ